MPKSSGRTRIFLGQICARSLDVTRIPKVLIVATGPDPLLAALPPQHWAERAISEQLLSNRAATPTSDTAASRFGQLLDRGCTDDRLLATISLTTGLIQSFLVRLTRQQ
ncbi:MAG: hypothetical protein ABS81_16385 [Pseudonocardia sp. SCN 72-86]|nr:MAG: hypothetical protein ABS81_16385 [Pseudonocardia sp. SCN 72-86]